VIPCKWSEVLAAEIEAFPAVRWVDNYGRNLVGLNRAARVFFYGSADQSACFMPSSHFRALVYPEDRGALELAIDEALRRGVGFDWCVRCLRPDGSYDWIKGLNWPVACPGKTALTCEGCPGAVFLATMELSGDTTFFRQQSGEAAGFCG
jgi:hypothetical protein